MDYPSGLELGRHFLPHSDKLGVRPMSQRHHRVSQRIEHHTVTRTQSTTEHRKGNFKTTIKMSFEPKTKIELDPPKDDIISLEYLSKCDGKLSMRLAVHAI
jgi:hypothetical protein